MKKFLNTFEDDFCAIILLIMLILTFINVIARYIILASMPFVEELNCVGLMIISILGAATAAKRQAHLGLSVITDLLPQMAQRVIALICDLLGAAFCAAIVYLGYLMVQNQLNNNILSMGMSCPCGSTASGCPSAARCSSSVRYSSPSGTSSRRPKRRRTNNDGTDTVRSVFPPALHEHAHSLRARHLQPRHPHV